MATKLPIGLLKASLATVRARLTRERGFEAEAELLEQAIAMLEDDRPSSGAERTRRWRAKSRDGDVTPGDARVTSPVTHARRHETVTGDVSSDAHETSRPPSALPLRSSPSDLRSSLNPSKISGESESARTRPSVPKSDAESDARRDVTRDASSFAAQVVEDEPGISGLGIADCVAIRLHEATGKRWDAMAHAQDLLWIADRPVAELERVLAALGADEWATANAGLVTPKHVRKHWPKYSDGPREVVTPERLSRAREADEDLEAELKRKLAEAEQSAKYCPPEQERGFLAQAASLKGQLEKVLERLGKGAAA